MTKLMKIVVGAVLLVAAGRLFGDWGILALPIVIPIFWRDRWVGRS